MFIKDNYHLDIPDNTHVVWRSLKDSHLLYNQLSIFTGWVMRFTRLVFLYPKNSPTVVPYRVRRHFRFEAKWSVTKAKFFSLWCEKSAFFAWFASMRNLEIWSETKWHEEKTKRKRSEKLPSFSLRSEMKWNGSKQLPSFSLQSEMKKNRSKIFFRFHAKKVVFFCLFSHLKQNENEKKRNQMKMKRKQWKSNQKEAKASKWKRIKWNSGAICKETEKNIEAGLLVFKVYT